MVLSEASLTLDKFPTFEKKIMRSSGVRFGDLIHKRSETHEYNLGINIIYIKKLM